MVANKMTGEKGVLFTAAYVTKFEEMENKLKPNIPQSLPEALRLAADLAEKNENLLLENAQKNQMINELQPKASYYDLVLQNKSLLSISKIAKDYGMSGTKMNKLLHELEFNLNRGTAGCYIRNTLIKVTHKVRHMQSIQKKADCILIGLKKADCLFTKR